MRLVEAVRGLSGHFGRGCEVPFRGFCCTEGGGGGRLRHATKRVKKEKKQEKEGLST